MLKSFKVRGIDKVEAYLKELPRGGVRVALAAFVEYVLGDKRHGLRHDEPQKYVSRARAGYTTSQAQMRFFFATGILERTPDGGIKLNRYQRTGETAAAWHAVKKNDWNYQLANDKPGAYWTRDEKGQTRQHALAGRRKVGTVVMANLAGGLRHATAAINKWMKQRGK